MIKMSAFFKSLLLPLCAVLSANLSAVTVDTNGIKNKAIFGIEFPEGQRSYVAQEKAVISISQQQYITSGFNVLELNIVTEGSALVRIYHSRAIQAGELQAALGEGIAAGGGNSSIIQRPLPPHLQKIADRANAGLETLTSSTVIKDYPLATHAHTIEYRISSRNELIDLYNQLKMHWLKEPAFFEAGQLVDQADAVDAEMEPRSLGGTVFTVEK